jgi:hypothetical protein
MKVFCPCFTLPYKSEIAKLCVRPIGPGSNRGADTSPLQSSGRNNPSGVSRGTGSLSEARRGPGSLSEARRGTDNAPRPYGPGGVSRGAGSLSEARPGRKNPSGLTRGTEIRPSGPSTPPQSGEARIPPGLLLRRFAAGP